MKSLSRRELITELAQPPDSGLSDGAHLATSSFLVVEKLGAPAEYRDRVARLVISARAWLLCDEVGFYALDATCPHLGSLTRCSDDHFVCPAHHSLFDLQGRRVAGPAAADLRCLEVDLDAHGHLCIRRDRVVGPDERFIA